LRAVVRFAAVRVPVVLRAVVRFAAVRVPVVLRAVVRFAAVLVPVVLRAVVRFAGLLRAELRFAAVRVPVVLRLVEPVVFRPVERVLDPEALVVLRVRRDGAVRAACVRLLDVVARRRVEEVVLGIPTSPIWPRVWVGPGWSKFGPVLPGDTVVRPGSASSGRRQWRITPNAPSIDPSTHVHE